MLAGLALHASSSATLARGEHPGTAANTPVTDGPFRYVRNLIYLAGITLLLGVGLLYSPLRAVDLGMPLLLLVYLHVAVVRAEEPELLRRFGSKVRRVLRASSEVAFCSAVTRTRRPTGRCS